MGDPAPGEARNQAVPHPVVDEPNEDDVHPDSLHNNKPAQPTVQQIAVANIQFNRRKKFSFQPDEWLRWIRRFERMRKATGLD